MKMKSLGGFRSLSTAVVYKYWKPAGVLSSLDPKVALNIFSDGKLKESARYELINQIPQVFPIGRLDKESSGLLLLTNDEKISKRLLKTYDENHPGFNQENDLVVPRSLTYGSKFEKIYQVTTYSRVKEPLVQKMRDGIVISTKSRRVGGKTRERSTLPCIIRRGIGPCDLVFHLREGRNRQIRKMVGKIGNSVVSLHRIECAGIKIDGLTAPGDLKQLSSEEWLVIQ